MPDLREAWQACLAGCPPDQQLYTFDWFQTWFDTYGRQPPWTGRVLIATATRENGETLAIMPFAHRRQKGLDVLSLAGLYQPVRSFACNPAVAKEAPAAILAALKEQRKDWDVLRFTPVDDATSERAALIEALQGSGLHRVEFPLGRTVVNHLESSIDAYASTHAMKRMHYYERRMRREGDAEFKHVHSPDVSTLKDLLEALRLVEGKSWIAEAGGDLRYATDTDFEFWLRVSEKSLEAQEQLDIWIATMNGDPVAFRFVVTTGDMSFLLANQYDTAYAKFSPGWVLFRLNLEYGIEHGIRCIDSAPGDLHYKSRLGGEEAHMRLDLLAFRPTLKGKFFATGIRGLHGIREKLSATRWGKPIANRLPRV